jgi:hypothetical protein
MFQLWLKSNNIKETPYVMGLITCSLPFCIIRPAVTFVKFVYTVKRT